MEPSSIYWQALYERLKGCGYSVFDLLRQGKFFLPVARDPDLKAAYRLDVVHQFFSNHEYVRLLYVHFTRVGISSILCQSHGTYLSVFAADLHSGKGALRP